MNLQESISNLQVVSSHLNKFLNDPKNYNNPLSQYLEQISIQCDKDAKNLEEVYQTYGSAI